MFGVNIRRDDRELVFPARQNLTKLLGGQLRERISFSANIVQHQHVGVKKVLKRSEFVILETVHDLGPGMKGAFQRSAKLQFQENLERHSTRERVKAARYVGFPASGGPCDDKCPRAALAAQG